MLKKVVKYEDYLGTVRTEELYFNLSKTELSDMQMSVDGGYGAKLQKMLDSVNNKDIYNTFVEIVLAAYGEVSPDGKYFLKTDENGHKLADKFRQSLAYDTLMDEITKDESTIAEFCNGIIPKEIRDAANEKPNGEFHPKK